MENKFQGFEKYEKIITQNLDIMSKKTKEILKRKLIREKSKITENIFKNIKMIYI